MRVYRTFLRFPIALALLFPPALSLQMPPQPGKLVIRSEPTGATIAINGKATGQQTDATFVVSPGTYKVSVGGPDGKSNCVGIILTVASGQTVGGVCSGTSWTPSS
jgi:PEGA domain